MTTDATYAIDSTEVPVLIAVLKRRVVPVLSLNDPNVGSAVGEALVRGGLPVAEVTLRSAGASLALAAMAQTPGLLVGAGTVTRPEQVDLIHDLGASFVVCPGFDPRIVRRCQALGLPVIPGISTASELMAALRAGVTTVKLFPAEAIGGLGLLKALSAPFPGVRFVPTGGVTEMSMAAYLAHPAVSAVGGSWIAPPEALSAGDFDTVADNARRAVAAATVTTP